MGIIDAVHRQRFEVIGSKSIGIRRTRFRDVLVQFLTLALAIGAKRNVENRVDSRGSSLTVRALVVCQCLANQLIYSFDYTLSVEPPRLYRYPGTI